MKFYFLWEECASKVRHWLCRSKSVTNKHCIVLTFRGSFCLQIELRRSHYFYTVLLFNHEFSPRHGERQIKYCYSIVKFTILRFLVSDWVTNLISHPLLCFSFIYMRGQFEITKAENLAFCFVSKYQQFCIASFRFSEDFIHCFPSLEND